MKRMSRQILDILQSVYSVKIDLQIEKDLSESGNCIGTVLWAETSTGCRIAGSSILSKGIHF